MMFDKTLNARLHPSGFRKCDSHFYSLNVLEDGQVYYTLCTHDIHSYGRVYKHDPTADAVELFADLREATGETAEKRLPHGKSHTPIFEVDGKVYLTTHFGYYEVIDGKEAPAKPPEGFEGFAGGKIIEYDRAAERFKVLATAPTNEGILTMNMDVDRKIIYGLTYPSGIFLYYDLNRSELKVVGPVSRGGEAGEGDEYFCLCRALAIDPRDGSVYFTNADGEILRFHTEKGAPETVRWAHMRKDVFGALDTRKGGHQGYNWRQIEWNPKYGKFYGVHGRSGYLFSFDPANEEMEVLDRICSEKNKKNGTYEVFRYGYMTLQFDPTDPEILYYISGFYKFNDPDAEKRTLALQRGHFDDAEGVTGMSIYLTLVTYHIGERKYEDHGVIRLEDGRYPSLTQSIAVHPDGRIYTVPWIPVMDENGNVVADQVDLISIDNPLRPRRA